MTSTERERLKENVREIIAGRDDGIELDKEFRWAVSGVQQSVPFFKNVHLLLAPDAILYFEGCSISRDVAAFYESHEFNRPAKVVRDTIFPVSECFHVVSSSEVLDKLSDLSASRSIKELFDHIKAYREEVLLFRFHDAFQNIFYISDRIAESAVAEFSNHVGATYRREPNVNKRIEGLKGLLKALENPSKIRIRGESWGSRLWRRLTWK